MDDPEINLYADLEKGEAGYTPSEDVSLIRCFLDGS